MITATEYLFRVGTGSLSAGFYLWIILFFVAMYRDPDRSDIVAWSINTQWAAMFRIFRSAAGFRGWGRIASGIVAFGVGCLVLSGLIAVINLFVNGSQG